LNPEMLLMQRLANAELEQNHKETVVRSQLFMVAQEVMRS